LLFKSTEEWLKILDLADVPCAPILRRKDVSNHAQIKANSTIKEYQHEHAGLLRQARPAARFSGTPIEITRGAPTLGEFGEEALRNLGYDDNTINSLIMDGVMFSAKSKITES
jgi:crotonobetainyl-CoA:carnitine CoA-transferase CaiB-like acyl-CoA transferase